MVLISTDSLKKKNYDICFLSFHEVWQEVRFYLLENSLIFGAMHEWHQIFKVLALTPWPFRTEMERVHNSLFFVFKKTDSPSLVTTAAMGNPLAIPLAIVTMSGTTSWAWKAQKWLPVRPKPVWTWHRSEIPESDDLYMIKCIRHSEEHTVHVRVLYRDTCSRQQKRRNMQKVRYVQKHVMSKSTSCLENYLKGKNI